MKPILISVLSLAGVAGAVIHHSHVHASANANPAEPLQHLRSQMEFTVHASVKNATAVFGAEGERAWSPDWDPQFVFPTPAKDTAGAVFRIKHSGQADLYSTWITPIFDVDAGHVQHIIYEDGFMVSLLDIHVAKLDASNSKVTVSYERTALSPKANETVIKLIQHYGSAEMAAHWEKAINGYFDKHR